MPDAARISVVVATKDRRDRLVRLLDALAAQEDAPPFEVVIVDDGSADGTRDAVGAHAMTLPFPVRVLRHDVSIGPGRARNRGWREATGCVIAFTDDDCVPSRRWLSALDGALGHDTTDLVAGVTTYPADQADRRGTWSFWLEDDGRSGHFSTCNMAYRRTTLEKVDGFDEDFSSANGEDTDLAWRAIAVGSRVAHAPEAIVYHDVTESSWRAYVKKLPRLEGLVLMIKKHPHLREHFGVELVYRTEDAVALAVLVGLGGLAVRRLRLPAAIGTFAAGAYYVRLFRRFRRPPKGPGGWVVAVPLGIAADAYAASIMIRASIRYRTILL